MKLLLLALSTAFAGFLSAEPINQDEAKASGLSDQALDMAHSDAAYFNGRYSSGPVEYAPPIIREHPYKVVRRVPVYQKVIDVMRPVIETVKVPITIRERRFAPAVVGTPGAPPQQGGPEQGPPQQDGPGGDQGGQPSFQGQGPGGQNGHPQFGGQGGQMPQMGHQQGGN